jgi:hypothetical protein
MSVLLNFEKHLGQRWQENEEMRAILAGTCQNARKQADSERLADLKK